MLLEVLKPAIFGRFYGRLSYVKKADNQAFSLEIGWLFPRATPFEPLLKRIA